jgi:hypothetical protein
MLDINDLVLVSVDDHIIEPPDLFTHHLAAKYLDRAPKLVRNEEGSPADPRRSTASSPRASTRYGPAVTTWTSGCGTWTPEVSWRR